MLFSVDMFSNIFLELLNTHDLNINLNHWNFRVLPLYCVLDILNSILCLTREFLKFLHHKTVLKLCDKTTFNSGFVDTCSIIIKIETKIGFVVLFSSPGF
jgi:hypothetical protein